MCRATNGTHIELGGGGTLWVAVYNGMCLILCTHYFFVIAYIICHHPVFWSECVVMLNGWVGETRTRMYFWPQWMLWLSRLAQQSVMLVTPVQKVVIWTCWGRAVLTDNVHFCSYFLKRDVAILPHPLYSLSTPVLPYLTLCYATSAYTAD